MLRNVPAVVLHTISVELKPSYLQQEHMKISLFAAAICCVLILPSCGFATAAISDSLSSEEQRVLAVEDEYVAAEVSRDEPTLRRILDDRFVHNSNGGTTSGKEDLINAVLGMNLIGQEISERTILLEGDVALIFGTATLKFGSDTGEETTSVLRYTSTYIKRNGEWRYLALQMAKHK